MIKEIKTKGFSEFMNTVKLPELQGKTLYCLFCGDKDKNGHSWCPDCVEKEPIVRKNLEKLDEGSDAVFIYCSVGGRDYWKDRSNDFRTHASLKLTGVPTLMKWGCPNQKLAESNIKDDLVAMLLEED